MNSREHKIYLKEFKAFSKSVVSSEKSVKAFLVRAGIHTPTGRLTKAYSSPASFPVNGKK